MNRFRLFNAILASMLLAGTLLVGLALLTVNTLDRRVIEGAAARNRHAEFLRAASVVGREIARPEDIFNTTRMKPVLEDILTLRPGIVALEIIEFISPEAKTVIKVGAEETGGPLSQREIHDMHANRVLSDLQGTRGNRAWIFTVPILSNGSTIGALRGKFSVSKYDRLIEEQEQVAKEVAIGAIVLTCLTLLLLIRIQIYRPIAQLLTTMEKVRAGNLTLAAPVSGPVEIRRLAQNFNQMMLQLHSVMDDKERLVKEISLLNANLEMRVTNAVSDLQRERDKVAAAQLVAQRNSNLAALGEVSAIMAHELGNPLNAMYGRVQMLKAADMPSELVRHVDVMGAQIARMSDVIKHILKSTRIEGESAPVRLNEVIEDTLKLIQAPDVNVVANLAPELPPVAVNETALHGVILNLLTNAVQAMKNKGELTVTTDLARSEELPGHVLVRGVPGEPPMVRLTVHDSGPGIPDHLLKRICEPFFTTRQEQGGTGLGLAVCRRVVASAAGQLAVVTSPAHGTTFIVDLPVWAREG